MFLINDTNNTSQMTTHATTDKHVTVCTYSYISSIAITENYSNYELDRIHLVQL